MTKTKVVCVQKSKMTKDKKQQTVAAIDTHSVIMLHVVQSKMNQTNKVEIQLREKNVGSEKGSVVDDKMLTKRVTAVTIKVSISGVCKMPQGTRNRVKTI